MTAKYTRKNGRRSSRLMKNDYGQRRFLTIIWKCVAEMVAIKVFSGRCLNVVLTEIASNKAVIKN